MHGTKVKTSCFHLSNNQSSHNITTASDAHYTPKVPSLSTKQNIIDTVCCCEDYYRPGDKMDFHNKSDIGNK